MANAEIFKTVFKGYNKEEVVAYIENLNRQLTQLQKELNEAKSSLEIMEQERVETAELQGQAVIDETALREELRAQVEKELRPTLEQEIRHAVESEMAPKYEEAVRNELQTRLQSQAEDIQELRRRAQLYDDNREVLAELMIKAKNDAAGIIQDAEEHARQLREEAEHKFRMLINDYDILKTNLLSAKGELIDKLEDAVKLLNEFDGEFSCMDQDVNHSLNHLQEV